MVGSLLLFLIKNPFEDLSRVFPGSKSYKPIGSGAVMYTGSHRVEDNQHKGLPLDVPSQQIPNHRSTVKVSDYGDEGEENQHKTTITDDKTTTLAEVQPSRGVTSIQNGTIITNVVVKDGTTLPNITSSSTTGKNSGGQIVVISQYLILTKNTLFCPINRALTKAF